MRNNHESATLCIEGKGFHAALFQIHQILSEACCEILAINTFRDPPPHGDRPIFRAWIPIDAPNAQTITRVVKKLMEIDGLTVMISEEYTFAGPVPDPEQLERVGG